MITSLRGVDMNAAPIWEARLMYHFKDIEHPTWVSTGIGKCGLITHTWGDDHQDKGLHSVISFWLNEHPETDAIQADNGRQIFPDRVIPDEKARLVVVRLLAQDLT
jgi:hypothetical protein